MITQRLASPSSYAASVVGLAFSGSPNDIRAPIKTALLPRIADAFSRLACKLINHSVKLFLRGSRETK